MIKLFAVVNGEILKDLGENTTPTYTRIHYLLSELNRFEDIEIISIQFKQLPRTSIINIVYNNIIKTVVVFRSILILLKKKPLVYFAYPHSMTTIQNRIIFRFCRLLKLKVILDIHDTIEQAHVIGSGKCALNSKIEGYCLRNATLLLSLNKLMWEHLRDIYKVPQDKKVSFIPNAFEDSFIKLYPSPYKSVENRFNICYIGGLTKNRGIKILTRACLDLHKEYSYLKLYLFGFYGAGISREIKDLIETNDFIIRKEVPRKNIPTLLNNIDLFVVLYNPHETYMSFCSPTKFFEYIGTGKPILCTKCKSLHDIGKNDAIMYVDYNAIDVKRKIELLINNPQMRENMSRKLLNVRMNHTWKERANQIYEEIKSL